MVDSQLDITNLCNQPNDIQYLCEIDFAPVYYDYPQSATQFNNEAAPSQDAKRSNDNIQENNIIEQPKEQYEIEQKGEKGETMDVNEDEDKEIITEKDTDQEIITEQEESAIVSEEDNENGEENNTNPPETICETVGEQKDKYVTINQLISDMTEDTTFPRYNGAPKFVHQYDCGDLFNKNLDKTTIMSDVNCSDYTYKNIIIDNSVIKRVIEISDGKEKCIKNIYQMYPSAQPTIVKTSCGSFYLDNENPHKTLLYANENTKWNIINSKNDNFFPYDNQQEIISQFSNSNFGSSITVSGNGLVCAIGGYTHNDCSGCVWIYENKNNYWECVQELEPIDNIGCSFIGISVSMNFDGSIIAIGGSGDNNGVGACWIYTKNTKMLTYMHTHKLIGTNAMNKSHQGLSVSISSDGTKLFVGGDTDNNDDGAIWSFGYINDRWIEIDKMTHYYNNDKNFGKHISSNFDGSLVAIGSDTNVYILNDGNIIPIHIDMDSAKDVKLNSNGNKLIVAYKNKLLLFKKCKSKDGGEYKMHRDLFTLHKNDFEIISCSMCNNGKTISISCFDNERNNCVICMTIKNKEYVMCNLKNLLCVSVENAPITMSFDGKITMVGLETIGHMSGGCHIFY